MLFNTPEFAVFLVTVLVAYHALPFRWQNIMLLVASYVFYGWWDYRFLGLILLSTVVDYICGLRIHASQSARTRRGFLLCSVLLNLGMLGVFKYYGFFAESLSVALQQIGLSVRSFDLKIVLPVGISFYTFQTLSYTIDIYRRQLDPTRNFLNFALFVSFFPQLVAGPIERAKHLLPILERPRRVTADQLYAGGWLILWGLFKKVVIADNLARTVDTVFADPGGAGVVSVLIATYAFAWQIYCDFSGYTDIARGTAKLMGVDLCLNFQLPYVSRTPSEFWKRWHISLSSWLRDYLYVPLGGNRLGGWKTYRNLFLTMVLGGLWHGANWTFVIWGAYQGLLLIAFRAFRIFSGPTERLSGGRQILQIVIFFHLTCFGWLIFRATDVNNLALLCSALLRPEAHLPAGWWRLVLVLPLVMVQFWQYRERDELIVFRAPVWTKALIYVGLYWSLLAIGSWSRSEFIYFQF